MGLHLVLLWMVVGLFIGQPYPQAQVAMLAMAVVAFELRSRLNLYSGIAIGLINLYVAATLSRDMSFLIFLLAYIGLMLAFMWRADDEDGLRDNPVILRPITTSRASNGRGTPRPYCAVDRYGLRWRCRCWRAWSSCSRRTSPDTRSSRP